MPYPYTGTPMPCMNVDWQARCYPYKRGLVLHTNTDHPREAQGPAHPIAMFSYDIKAVVHGFPLWFRRGPFHSACCWYVRGGGAALLAVKVGGWGGGGYGVEVCTGC